MSAGTIQSQLSSESKTMWAYRSVKEQVLLMDWDSKAGKFNKPLVTLKNILENWDPDVTYRNPIMVLDGGYGEFMDYYPSYTTNSVNRRPKVETVEEVNLDDVEYSSLHEVPMRDERIFHQPDDIPIIDRSSKAAAEKKYSNLQEKREQLVDDSLMIEEQLLDKISELNEESIHKYHGDEAKYEEARLNINNERMELEDKQEELKQLKLKFDNLHQQLQEEKAKHEQYRMDVDSSVNAEVEKRIAEKERMEIDMRAKRKREAELVELRRQREMEVNCESVRCSCKVVLIKIIRRRQPNRKFQHSIVVPSHSRNRSSKNWLCGIFLGREALR